MLHLIPLRLEDVSETLGREPIQKGGECAKKSKAVADSEIELFCERGSSAE